jgi:FtsH-binding integral membrane protein
MTVLVGVANFIPTCICPFIIDRTLHTGFGRKPIMAIGSLGIIICNFVIGYCSWAEVNPWVVVGFILVFLVFFEFSYGPIFWVYCSETMIDKSVGICAAVNWIACSVIVMTLLALVSPTVLGVSGTFFLYGVISVVGLVIILAFVPESKKQVS